MREKTKHCNTWCLQDASYYVEKNKNPIDIIDVYCFLNESVNEAVSSATLNSDNFFEANIIFPEDIKDKKKFFEKCSEILKEKGFSSRESYDAEAQKDSIIVSWGKEDHCGTLCKKNKNKFKKQRTLFDMFKFFAKH